MVNGETEIEFADGGSQSAVVVSLGERLYRIECVLIVSEDAAFMDVIEADEKPDGTLLFRRVVQKSHWRDFDFVTNREFIGSDACKAVLAKAASLGGRRENCLGGLLLICLPPGVEWDPTPELVE